MMAQIINLVRLGAMLETAARTVGISPRTLREWIQRGEGRHPDRPATPKLRRFVRELRQAQAEARARIEIQVYQQHPKYWLTHAARTTPEQEGWTELRVNDRVPEGSLQFEELMAELDRDDLEEAAHEEALKRFPDCKDPNTCAHPDHRKEYNDVYHRILDAKERERFDPRSGGGADPDSGW